LAGKIEDVRKLNPYFNKSAALTELTSSRKAEGDAAKWLEQLAGNLARQRAI
jgi:hypothetical protein